MLKNPQKSAHAALRCSGHEKMCGICGKISTNDKPNGPESIRSMCAAMACRGPDDAGMQIFKADGSGARVGLGHQRLSILDLSPAGRQPMANEDGTIWLTYNGEVYNYKALRGELEAKGHRFRSDSDTEVVIHLYEEEGLEAVKRFNGMFAFGLWDEKGSASGSAATGRASSRWFTPGTVLAWFSPRKSRRFWPTRRSIRSSTVKP